MMKPLRIDFSTPSFMRAVWLTSPVTWLFGIVGAGLCISMALHAASLQQKRQTLQDHLRQMQARLTAHRVQSEPVIKSTISENQVNAINAAVGQLNLPWGDVFNTIESATPVTIALLSLEPDAKRHLLKGWAEAKTTDDMIAYIESLRGQPFIQVVMLIRHEINEQDPNKPLRFQFEAQWARVVR